MLVCVTEQHDVGSKSSSVTTQPVLSWCEARADDHEDDCIITYRTKAKLEYISVEVRRRGGRERRRGKLTQEPEAL